MRIAVCIQKEETQALISQLLKAYQDQRGCRLSSCFFKNDTELICSLAGGEYDVIFFSDGFPGNLAKEVRTTDRRVRLVRVAAADSVAQDSGDVWYCLPEPPSAAFLFPILDRLRADAVQASEAGLLVKSRGSVMQLDFSHIEYVEVMGRTVFFHLADGSTEEVAGVFSDFEARLLQWPDFVKVHRAYIINMSYVQKLEPGGVLTRCGHSVPISRGLYSQFRKDYLCRLMYPEVQEESPTPTHAPAPASPPDAEGAAASGYAILLVDDEEEQRLRWAGVLLRHGCTVRTADCGEAALRLAPQVRFDCVVLDVKLGERSGFELCQELGARTGAPVIFLSSLDDSESQTKGFLSGGLDYITKDATDQLFWLKLETRIRMARAGKAELTCGNLYLDLKARRAFLQETEVSLTSVEFDLLWLLMRRPGAIYTPTQIYEAIWGAKQRDDGQAVQLRLSLLQRKLEAVCPRHSFIETVWGKGYRFVTLSAGEETAIHEAF